MSFMAVLGVDSLSLVTEEWRMKLMLARLRTSEAGKDITNSAMQSRLYYSISIILH